MNTIGFFFRNAITLFAHPVRTLRAVDRDDRRVAHGLLGSLFLTFVYVIVLLTAHFLGSNHVPAESGLVLRIPADRYYFWELFLLLPAALGGAILAAGAVRLCATAWAGRGSFERLFALFGFGYVPVAVVMGLPDLVLDFWPAAHFYYVHVALGTAAYLAWFILAVKEVEALSWPMTVTLAFVGAICNALVQFVLIR